LRLYAIIEVRRIINMSNLFALPVQGKYRVTSPFGWRIDPVTKKATRHHNGDDIITGRKNEKVYAVMNGKVLKSRKSTAKGGGFGNYIVIRHFISGKYYTSLYAHLQDGSSKVRQGQMVKAGDQVGVMGDTGYVTGLHLHFEIWKGRTHGWSQDGKGFLEPLKFILSMIALNEVKANTPKATPKPKQPAEPESRKVPRTRRVAVKSSKPLPVVTPVKKPTVSKPKTHTVKSGDTLGAIARTYKTTVAILAKLNKIDNVNLINVGQVIRLP
jgi:murein DD-endopeptidase MepM/ murein hydrolase activator NlpD